tara:strand:- start:4002 stop:4892 length:891 start_codon:yes stop_codon:yes gene_type:complete
LLEEIIFGTRGSPLALIQTNSIIKKLIKLFPETKCKIKIIETEGDRDQDISLTLTEQLGLFSSEIQSELIKKNIDLAVHSLKDVPVDKVDMITLAAVPDRINEKDLLYHENGLNIYQLPKGSVIGTCSLRRKLQIESLRKDLVVKDIRGNIDSRIGRVKSGEYSAIVLAAAGLIRLGYDISKYYVFNFDEMVPAPGQGALAVEARKDDPELLNMISQINNIYLQEAVDLERELLKYIGLGCSSPIGAFATSYKNGIDIHACYIDPDTGKKTVVKKQRLTGASKELVKGIARELFIK